MRGSLVRRGKNRWALVLDLGYLTKSDGTRKRKQKWISFAGTKKEAGDKLTELVRAANRNEFVEPSKMTLIAWLREWLAKTVTATCRPSTQRSYTIAIEQHIAKHDIASLPIQKVRPSDLEAYYHTLKDMPATQAVHHAILHRALSEAARDNLIFLNPASKVRRPKRQSDTTTNLRRHCWSASEARCVLNAAKAAPPQLAAFVFLALDTGARKSELHGLLWSDVDLDAASATFRQQLDIAGNEPVFGPIKTKEPRVVTLGPETVAMLRAHRQHQNTLKMKNRTNYTDFGLVFAREHEDMQAPEHALGQPLKTLSESRFRSLVKTAGVKPIKFHGVRHTVATLALQAGVPVHVVAQRLGHRHAEMTLQVYAHALPDQQRDAASRLSALYHG